MAGDLIVPATSIYRFAVPAGDAAMLDVDGVRLAGSRMRIGSPVVLSRCLHALRMEYAQQGTHRYVSLLWAAEDGGLRTVPWILLLPDVAGHGEVRQRRLLVSLDHRPAFGGLLLIVLPAGWAICSSEGAAGCLQPAQPSRRA